MKTSSHGQLMTRYFNRVKHKAYSSLDKHFDIIRKPKANIRWFDEPTKKHHFVDKPTR
jgi:hypothetical protein